MLVVDGYKMAEVVGKFRFSGDYGAKELTADSVFLYRPDTDLWYIAPCKEYPWGATFKRDELVEILEKGKENGA